MTTSLLNTSHPASNWHCKYPHSYYLYVLDIVITTCLANQMMLLFGLRMFRPNVDETSDDDGGGHDAFEDIAIGPSTDQYMYGKLDRVSAALIDSSRITELLSFSSRDIDCRLSFTNAKTRLAIAVGNVQLDQSSALNKKVPVILSPTPVKHPQPLVQFLAWRDNYRSKSDLDSYEYVAIQLQEMDLKVEESWLYEMWEFYLDVMKKREGRASRWHQDSKVKYSSTCAFEDDLEDHCGDAVEKASLFLKEGKKVKSKKIYVSFVVMCKLDMLSRVPVR